VIYSSDLPKQAFEMTALKEASPFTNPKVILVIITVLLRNLDLDWPGILLHHGWASGGLMTIDKFNYPGI
jgi:hypothetical protein